MHVPAIGELRARQTRKWTQFPDDVLPAWIAESDFSTCPAVLAEIEERVRRQSLGYTPAHDELGEALSQFYAARYDFRPDPDYVMAVPDVVRGLLLAVKHFTRPGSSIVVPVPAYPPFLQIPAAAGRKQVEIACDGAIDLGRVEEAFQAGAGSMLVCSPYNPLGFTLSREFLTALVDLADRHDARLLVDEIHAPLVLDGSHVCAAGLQKPRPASA